jgi:hypothetical protein
VALGGGAHRDRGQGSSSWSIATAVLLVFVDEIVAR